MHTKLLKIILMIRVGAGAMSWTINAMRMQPFRYLRHEEITIQIISKKDRQVSAVVNLPWLAGCDAVLYNLPNIAIVSMDSTFPFRFFL